MDFNPLSMFFSFAFGVVGWVFFRQGKTEGQGLRMIVGIALMGYSMFVKGPIPTLLVGVLLSLVPWGADRI